MQESEILIIGCNGQLGRALKEKYPAAKAVDSSELDIGHRDSVLGFNVGGIKYIINAAAYTNVDGAETPEGRVAAWRVNSAAVGYLAEMARANDITLIQISTDYVFDGTQDNHIEDEPLSPLSAYGASKAAGDIAALLNPKTYVLRTSWVVGEGKNFVRTMLDLGQKGVAPKVVSDQIGRLTFTSTLVDCIDYILSAKAPHGVYNVSNQGEPVSWADVAREVFRLAGFTQQVTDTTTEEYYAGKQAVAPRPLKSTLDLTKIIELGFKPNNWPDDLREYITKEKRA
jgi:dTDP-4-dehydrorhamnose 3,5-epimerase